MQRVARIYLKEVATPRGKKIFAKRRYYILSFDQSLTPNLCYFLRRAVENGLI